MLDKQFVILSRFETCFKKKKNWDTAMMIYKKHDFGMAFPNGWQKKLNFATFDVAAIYDKTCLCETAYNLSLMLSRCLINV